MTPGSAIVAKDIGIDDPDLAARFYTTLNKSINGMVKKVSFSCLESSYAIFS
jgi:hypothetical protein